MILFLSRSLHNFTDLQSMFSVLCLAVLDMLWFQNQRELGSLHFLLSDVMDNLCSGINHSHRYCKIRYQVSNINENFKACSLGNALVYSLFHST